MENEDVINKLRDTLKDKTLGVRRMMKEAAVLQQATDERLNTICENVRLVTAGMSPSERYISEVNLGTTEEQRWHMGAYTNSKVKNLLCLNHKGFGAVRHFEVTALNERKEIADQLCHEDMLWLLTDPTLSQAIVMDFALAGKRKAVSSMRDLLGIQDSLRQLNVLCGKYRGRIPVFKLRNEVSIIQMDVTGDNGGWNTYVGDQVTLDSSRHTILLDMVSKEGHDDDDDEHSPRTNLLLDTTNVADYLSILQFYEELMQSYAIWRDETLSIKAEVDVVDKAIQAALSTYLLGEALTMDTEKRNAEIGVSPGWDSEGGFRGIFVRPKEVKP